LRKRVGGAPRTGILPGVRATSSTGHGAKEIFVAGTRDPGTRETSDGARAASTAAARDGTTRAGARDVGPAPLRRKMT